MSELLKWSAMPYRKKLQIRMTSGAILTVIGGLAFAFALYFQDDVTLQLGDHLYNFYLGAGSGVFFAGIFLIIRLIAILKNPDWMRKQEIKESDERNIYIGQKTWALSGFIFFLLLYIGMMVAGFFSETVMKTLMVVFGTLAGVMGLVRLYLKQRV